MKKFIIMMLVSSIALSGYAKNIDFKLDSVPLPKAIALIYDEVLDKSFMLDPVIANDNRVISFKASQEDDFNLFFKRYLENLNIKVFTKNNVDYLQYVEPKIPQTSFVYNPIHRDVDYLASFLKIDNGQVSASGDKLVLYGSHQEIAKAKTILKSLDTKAKEIIVTGYVFEVSSDEAQGSGINFFAKLLSNKLGLNIGRQQSFENFITLNIGNLDAVIELFRTDKRFYVLSSPTLRVKSGSKGNFSVGSDVPIIGNITYDDGRPIQSIEYRSSGVLFEIQPTIKANTIDLKIEQQLSNFVRTDTGVNQSPTLIKRDITTDVSLKNGEVIVLGGLAENKITEGETGFSFLPSWLLSGSSKSKNKTDILILLQVREI